MIETLIIIIVSTSMMISLIKLITDTIDLNKQIKILSFQYKENDKEIKSLEKEIEIIEKEIEHTKKELKTKDNEIEYLEKEIKYY